MNTPVPEPLPLVLLIDDNADETRLVRRWLEIGGYRVESRGSGIEGIDALHKTLPDVVLLDIQMDGMDGMEVLHRVRSTHPDVPVIMFTADASPAQAVRATKEGAYDYLVKPADRTKLITITRNAINQGRLTSRLRRLESGNGGIYGESAPVQRLQAQLERVAPRDITVQVHGESGTGKELVARAIHQLSGRKGSFVAINCASLTRETAESELFGHEKGAYTGAHERRKGRFEQANGGTLFLDEVAELDLDLQARLLRVVQERRISRMGTGTPEEIKVDVRLVTATHKDLAAEVRAGRFREDLYFRLVVFEITVPTLRERGGDIILLANRFLDEICRRYSMAPRQLSPETEVRLLRYSWPGNVRELQNAIERAVVDSTDTVIRPENLPRTILENLERASVPPAPVALPASPPVSSTSGLHSRTLEEIIRIAIDDSLQRNKGNVMAACRELDIPRTTMYRKLKDYGLRGIGDPT